MILQGQLKKVLTFVANERTGKYTVVGQMDCVVWGHGLSRLLFAGSGNLFAEIPRRLLSTSLHYMLQCPPEIAYCNDRVNAQALVQFIATNSHGLQVLTDCSLQVAEIADEVIKTWHCHSRSH